MVALTQGARVPCARYCSNPMRLHQPAPTSHLVAIVCSNCLITHTSEDRISDGSTYDDRSNTVDLFSLSDDESGEDGMLPIPDNSTYGGLPTILEIPSSGSWSDSEPSEELGGSQPTSEEISDSSHDAPQEILLQQVLMTKPVGTTTSLIAQIPPATSVATTNPGLVAPHLPVFEPPATITHTRTTPLITTQ